MQLVVMVAFLLSSSSSSSAFFLFFTYHLSSGERLVELFLSNLGKKYLHEDEAVFTEFLKKICAVTGLPEPVARKDYFTEFVLYEFCEGGFEPRVKGGTSLLWPRAQYYRAPDDIDIRIDPDFGVQWGKANRPNAFPPENTPQAYASR